MAIQHNLMSITREAENDLSSNQYYCVELVSNNRVDVCDAQGELAIGILQNEPEAGENASVMISGISKVVSHDTNIVAGSKLTTDANGKVEVASSADEVIGIALEAASSTDDIISMLVCPMGVL